MQSSFRLIASSDVKRPTRIDLETFPELKSYLSKDEKLILLPESDLAAYTELLRHAGHNVYVGRPEPVSGVIVGPYLGYERAYMGSPRAG